MRKQLRTAQYHVSCQTFQSLCTHELLSRIDLRRHGYHALRHLKTNNHVWHRPKQGLSSRRTSLRHVCVCVLTVYISGWHVHPWHCLQTECLFPLPGLCTNNFTTHHNPNYMKYDYQNLFQNNIPILSYYEYTRFIFNVCFLYYTDAL